MPILNYTTEVDAMKTAGQIQGILASKGARQISIDYDGEGIPVAVEFMIIFNNNPVRYRLPCNVEGVFQAMRKYGSKVPPRYQNKDQARRVAWRIVKDWVEAQLALVEAAQAQMAEVFLAYAVHESGQTLFQYFTNNPSALIEAQPAQRLLGSGDVVDGEIIG